MKGLMDRCVSQATMLDHVRARAEAELGELKAWKVVQEKKFDLTKRLLEAAEEQTEALKKVLKDKEDEISQSKKQLHLAKENVIKEYHDSNALLAELSGSLADGFDDYLCQVKAPFLNLDLSHITIDAEGQTPARPVEFEGTNELFADDINPDPQGDGAAIHADKEKSVEDGICQLEVDQTAEEKKEETLVAQQQFLFIYYYYPFFFFFILCILSIFVDLREHHLFLLSPIVFGFLQTFAFHRPFIYCFLLYPFI